jgi:biopolymer transport protein ExbB
MGGRGQFKTTKTSFSSRNLPLDIQGAKLMGDFLEFLKGSFFHVAPIILVGGFAVAIIFERISTVVFKYPMTNPKAFFEKTRDLVMADRTAEAIALCDQFKGKPVAHIVREALLRAHEPEIMIEDGLELAVTESTLMVQKRTPFLATIANVSTLLGLLGTIVGLIHSFEAVGNVSAQQRAASLAAGISTAMNSTMLGLAVAIPCMLAYSYLMNHTNRLLMELDQAAVKILDMIRHRHYSSEIEFSQGQQGSDHPAKSA